MAPEEDNGRLLSLLNVSGFEDTLYSRRGDKIVATESGNPVPGILGDLFVDAFPAIYFAIGCLALQGKNTLIVEANNDIRIMFAN